MSYEKETPEERKARWKRLHEMTEEEIEANIASDPDAQVPIGAFRNGGLFMSLDLDSPTLRWLEQHPMDYQSFLSGVLKAYVESQRKHS